MNKKELNKFAKELLTKFQSGDVPVFCFVSREFSLQWLYCRQIWAEQAKKFLKEDPQTHFEYLEDSPLLFTPIGVSISFLLSCYNEVPRATAQASLKVEPKVMYQKSREIRIKFLNWLIKETE